MSLLELVFDGDDERRLAERPAHRERLAQHEAAGRLVMAGPWDDDSGALLIFRCDEQGMQEIISADPYYSTPGVTIASVRPWTPIFGVDRPSTVARE